MTTEQRGARGSLFLLRGGAQEKISVWGGAIDAGSKILEAGQGGAGQGVKFSGRGGVTVKLGAFSGRGGAGRASLV